VRHAASQNCTAHATKTSTAHTYKACNTITVPGMPWWEQRVLLEMGEKKERAWHLHTLPGVCDVHHPPAVETHYYWHCKAMTVHG
jgi:hypothetical protein